MVKQFLRDASGAGGSTSRHMPQMPDVTPAIFAEVSKAIRPSDAETTRNPRARSATLRHATRTAAPARNASGSERPLTLKGAPHEPHA